MSKAVETISRRAALKAALGTTAAVATGAVVTGSAEAAEPDPIFALIEAHRRAWEAEAVAARAVEAVEERETGKASPERITPALREAEAVMFAAGDETDRLAVAMVTTAPPITATGALALLRHGVECGDVAGMLPDEIQITEAGEPWCYSWHEQAARVALPLIEPAFRNGGVA